MNFKQSVAKCLNNYVTFSGRAQRSEYWYFVLFGVILGFLTGFLDAIFFGAPSDPNNVQPLNLIASLAMLLPGLSVSVRRLHDINRSGWWQLIVFIPVVGFILLIVWFCARGTQGDNRFGPDPLSQMPLPPPAMPSQSQQL